MVKTLMAKVQNALILSFLLPFVYGCNGSSTDSASSNLGSLFGFSPSGGSSSAGLVGDGGAASGEALASVHNPEPATMLLIGGGIVAMRYLSGRQTNKLK